MARTCHRLGGVVRAFFGSIGVVKSTLLGTEAILVTAAVLVLGSVLFSAPQPARAATTNYLNFQGRLLGASGALVDDGTYNVQFNLYTVSGGGSTEWTETYLNNAGQGVTVKNGYFSVQLGSITSFPGTINWDQQQWLGMTVRGTGSCSFGACTPTDAEMTPRFALTAVPYAFQAANALGVASNGTNAVSANSGDVTIKTGNAAGATSNSGSISIDTGTATGTAGSISLGATNASALTLGRSGLTVTIPGVLGVNTLTPTSALTIGATGQAFTLQGSSGSVITGTNSGFKTTLGFTTPTATQTYNLPNSPAGTYTICTTASASCGTAGTGYVQFAPSGAQTDATGNPTIYINKTNSANILQLQRSGVDKLIVDQDGKLSLSAGSGNATAIGHFTSSDILDPSIQLDAPSTGIALRIGGTGAVKIDSPGNVGGRLQLDDSGNLEVDRLQHTFYVDASNDRVGIGTAAPTATLQVTPAANSTATFQVQNASGRSVLNLDTATTTNLITNSGFEAGTTGWASQGAASIAQNNSNYNNGTSSLAVTTTAAAGDGTKFTYALASTTTYSLSFYARLTSGSMSTLQAGRSDDGSTNTNCTLNTTTLSTSGWTRFYCTFTTGATSGTRYIFINQSDASARTIYIDSVQLEASSVASVYNSVGQVYLDGYINRPLQVQVPQDTTNALDVRSASGKQIFAVDTLNQGVVIGSTSNANSLTILDSSNAQVLVVTANKSAGGFTNRPFIAGNPVFVGQLGFEGGSYLQVDNSAYITGITSASRALTVRGQASQSVDLLQVQDNSANALAGFDSGGQLYVGRASALAGTAKFYNATNANTATLQSAVQTANTIYQLPIASAGTYDICTTANNCASLTGYIQNSTSLQTSSNFYIQSNATGSITARLKQIGSQTADILTVEASGSTTALSGIDASANFYLGAGQSLKVNGSTSFPSSPTEGQVYFRTDNKQLYVYENAKWQADRSTATLIVAASNSQNKEKADYVATGTNDEVTLAAAVSALPASGGTIVLLDGTFNISSTTLNAMTTKSGVNITGQGRNTIIKRSATSYDIFNNVSPTNMRIDSVTFDDNNDGFYIFRLSGASHFTVSNSYFINCGIACMFGSGTDIKVMDSYFSGSTGYGVRGAFTLLSGNYFTGFTTGVEDNSSNGVISGNIFTGNSVGISTSGSSVDITGNIIYSNTSTGIFVNGSDTQVTSNKIYSNSGTGIVLNNNSDRALVSGNEVHGNNAGIGHTVSNNVTITGNTVSNNTTFGIQLNYGSYALVSSNTVYNNGGSGSSDNISLTNAVVNATIVDNRITDTAGTGNAIAINPGPTNTYLSNNTFSGTGASTILDSGTGTIYANQLDNNGNLVISGQAGVGINTQSASASLQNTGGIINSQLATPGPPTVSNQGAAGSTSYTYKVTATDGLGETAASSATTTATGNATLNGTNFNRIVPARVPGALTYKIYRTASSGTPGTTGLIGTLGAGAATFQFDDTGIAGGAAAPGANTTGNIVVQGGSVTVGTTTQAGSLVLNDGNGGQTATIQLGNISANTVLTLPATLGTTDTFCFATLANCAPAAGTYITNGTTLQTTATFSIQAGTTTFDTARITQLTNQTGALLHIVRADTTTDVLKIDGASGGITSRQITDSAVAFQVQNAAGSNVFAINTLTTTPNLVGNNSFEANANGWSAKGSATITADSTSGNALYGKQTLKIVDTASNDGARYDYTFTPSTQYTLSLWAKTASGSTTIILGRQETGTNVETGCSSGSATTTWTQISCTFTTGSSINTSPNFYLRQTVAGTPTIYIDGVTLTTGASALTFVGAANSAQFDAVTGSLKLNGGGAAELQPWQTNTTSLPAALNWPGAATANGYVYIVGGSTSGTDQAGVYYAKINADGTLGSWTTNANSLPVARSNTQSVVVNGYLYSIGSNSANRNSVYYARLNNDGSTGTWFSGTVLPVGIDGEGFVTAYGYLYVYGGWNGSTQNTLYSAKVNADGSIGAWTTSPNSMPIVRGYFATVGANGYAYAIGGLDAGGGSSQTSVYYTKLNSDGTTTAWSTNATSLPAGTRGESAVVINGYMYVYGGWDGTNPLSAVYYAKVNSDGSLGAWFTGINSMSAGRRNAGYVTVNGYVYSIGGNDGTNDLTAIYYTSAARTTLNGSLDLVGATGQSLTDQGGGGMGSLGGTITAGNGSFIGTLQVEGLAQFNQGVSVTGAISASGQVALQNATNSTTAFQIQTATGNSLFTADTTNGALLVGGAPDATTGPTLTNSAAGTFGAQTNRDGVFSQAVYNGKLYAAVNEVDGAGIYRYDGGTTWTLVTNAVGKIIAGDTANIDSMVLTVFNGRLYAGTHTGAATNTGAVYSYDGTTWSLVNATRGTFGAETNVDGVDSFAVYNGKLYLVTDEPDAAGLYRFDGGTTFTRLNATVGKGLAEATADIDGGRLVEFNSSLWWGVTTGSTTARIYKYDGNTFTLMTPTPGTIAGVASNANITSMAVFNGQLIVGVGATNAAFIAAYNGGDDRAATPGDDWIKTTDTTNGKIVAGDTANIDSITALRVYNGRLYAATDTGSATNTGALYEYDGLAVNGSTNGWTLVNATRGTFGSQTNIDKVSSLMEYNGALYIGTDDGSSSNIGSVYSYTKTSGNSYVLKFASDTTSTNTGTIGFVGSQQSVGNALNTGTFTFSHGISTTTGAYDLAEDYPTRDTTLAAGALVSIDPHEEKFVQKASAANASLIVGVYSTDPALHLSQADATIDGARAVPVALAGRVPVAVSTENGPILPGDPITVSALHPGVGVKAITSGRIVGMSMGSYNGAGIGTVTVFVNPSFYTEQSAQLVQSAHPYFASVNVGGLAQVSALSVTDEATIVTLKVTGLAEFAGDIKIVAPVNTRAAITRIFTASEAIVPGSVVVLDPTHDGQVGASSTEEDTKVIGVAVTQAQNAGDAIEVAVSGSVQVSVDTSLAVHNSALPGSLVVTSGQGVGLATTTSTPVTGAVLGKTTSRPDANNRMWIFLSLE